MHHFKAKILFFNFYTPARGHRPLVYSPHIGPSEIPGYGPAPNARLIALVPCVS